MMDPKREKQIFQKSRQKVYKRLKKRAPKKMWEKLLSSMIIAYLKIYFPTDNVYFAIAGSLRNGLVRFKDFGFTRRELERVKRGHFDAGIVSKLEDIKHNARRISRIIENRKEWLCRREYDRQMDPFFDRAIKAKLP